MNWQEILVILVPIFGLMAWSYSRIEKKAEDRQDDLEKRFEKIDQRFEKMDQQFNQRFDQINQRFDQVDQKLQSLDMRLTRLEGRFDERGYWESREWHKTGTEDKK